MDDRTWKKKIRGAADRRLSGLEEDPFLAGKILAQGPSRGHKKVSLAAAFLAGLVFAAAAAFAAAAFIEHDVVTYDEARVADLMPDTWHSIGTPLSEGFVIGGCELGEDYVGPMTEDMVITRLDGDCRPVWVLEDARLAGCRFDGVEEAEGALYFGGEAQDEAGDWRPVFMKVEETGQTAWMLTLDDALFIARFRVNAAGSLYCVGTRREEDGQPRAVLIKISPEGEICWEKTEWGRETLEIGDAVLRGEELLLGGICEKGAALFRLDADGHVHEERFFPVKERILSLSFSDVESSENGVMVLKPILVLDLEPEEDGAEEMRKYILLNDDL